MKAKPEWFKKVCRGLEETKAVKSKNKDKPKIIKETEISLRVILKRLDAEQVADAISKGLIKHVSINY